MSAGDRAPHDLPIPSIDADSVEEALSRLFGDGVSIRERRGVGGGSINEAHQLVLGDGTHLFLKSNDQEHRGLFLEEARGLLALRAGGGPRVPQPWGVARVRRRQYLILEWIERGRPSPSFWPAFGRSLASLHRSNRSRRCGFPRDNHIGATPQPNGWIEDWHQFFAERRLQYQVHLARDRGRADAEMVRGVERIVRRLEEILPAPEGGEASILHGDLWGGNFLVSVQGEPVLIDPAVYFGHREADLAMTELFGGFQSGFYAGYREEWPLEPGYEERRDLYNLYHLLNHLNLFGASYAGSCRRTIRRYR